MERRCRMWSICIRWRLSDSRSTNDHVSSASPIRVFHCSLRNRRVSARSNEFAGSTTERYIPDENSVPFDIEPSETADGSKAWLVHAYVRG